MALIGRSLTSGRGAGVDRPFGARTSSLGLVAAAALLASCTSILGDFGDGVIPPPGSGGSMSGGGDGGSSGEGGAGEGGGGAGGASGSGGTAECPSGKGPAMVKVPGDSGSFYCVDSTEVTIAQYKEFLDTSPDAQAQPAFCKPWNASHEPKLAGSCATVDFDPEVVPDEPMVCVNWCDARAFCAWAGKRLCGAVGGGPNAFGLASSPALSQWYRACSAAGVNSFPYGNQYDDSACVGDAYDGVPGFDPTSDTRQDVGTAPGCEGGYPGLFDLSGNVQEWEDTCQTEAGQNDNCLTRGGSVEQGAPALFCNAEEARARNTARNEVGFRCCADLKMN